VLKNFKKRERERQRERERGGERKREKCPWQSRKGLALFKMAGCFKIAREDL